MVSPSMGEGAVDVKVASGERPGVGVWVGGRAGGALVVAKWVAPTVGVAGLLTTLALHEINKAIRRQRAIQPLAEATRLLMLCS